MTQLFRVSRRTFVVAITLCAALVLGYSVPTFAAAPIIPPPPTIHATSYLLIDATSEKVLVEHNAHERKPPASLTKIMTAYLAEQEITAGRISTEDEVLISVRAWRTGGSKMFIREGTQVKVADLLRGVIIQSGNDASIAIAEHIAGSEEAFADMMNQQASVLGMVNSQFRNATGLPSEEHYSSAWDLALLTRDLINRFPEHYATYSERSFKFNDIEQPNRNDLLWRDKTVDGVKTGYTRAAGYCLVASAVREGMRLVSVVMGTDSDQARMRESQKLLSYGFRYFETQTLYEKEVSLKEHELFYGEVESVSLGLAEDVTLTFPRGYYKDIEVNLEVPKLLEAPLSKGDRVGEITLTLGENVLYNAPLLSLEDIAEAGIFGRLSDFITLFFTQIFGGQD
jgi:D-alanyl-D-alanine carboxypeptidase (penicillin-binding protein 5/6)